MMTTKGRPKAKYPPILIRVVIEPTAEQVFKSLSPTQRGELIARAIKSTK